MHGVEHRPGLSVGAGRRRLTVRVDRRELGVVGQEPELLLSRQDAGADRLVALVELALVLVGPLLEDVVWRVPAPGEKYMKNGLSGSIALASRMNSIALSAKSLERW